MRQVLLGHADPGVGHHDLVAANVAAVLLRHRHAHRVAGLGVLERVGEQVVHHLREAHRVTEHPGVGRVHARREGLALLVGLHLEGGNRVAQGLGEVHALARKGDLAALHARDLQDVVDEVEELVARLVDAPQVVGGLLGVGGVAARELGEADDGVERRAHVVAHVVEERLLGLEAVLRGVERLLEVVALAELALLLRVDLAEAQHDLVRRERLVVEHAHVDPAVALAELAQEVSAVVAHAARHQAPDVLGREALLELAEGVLLDDLARGAQQVGVGPPRRYAVAHVVGALDHLVGALVVVDQVDGVVGVAEHAHGLVGALHRAGAAPVAHAHHGKSGEKRHAHRNKHQVDGVEVAQDERVGRGHHRVPAVGEPRIVHRAPLAARVHEVRVVALELARVYARDEVGEVGRDGGGVQVGPGVEGHARRVAQEVRDALGQVRGRKAELEALGVDVKGQDRVHAGAGLGDRDHGLAGDRVLVDVGEDGLAAALRGRLVPGARGRVRALPQVRHAHRQHAAAHDPVQVDVLVAEHGAQALAVEVGPLLDGVPRLLLVDARLDGGGAKLEQGLVGDEVAVRL